MSTRRGAVISVLPWLFGGTLAMIPMMMIFFPDHWKMLLAPLLALLALACLATQAIGERVGLLWGIGLALILAPMLASANTANLASSIAIPILMLFMAVFGATLLCDSQSTVRNLQIIACCLAAGLVIVILYVLATGDIPRIYRQRLRIGGIGSNLLPLHPNYIGLMALVMAAAAFPIHKRSLKRTLHWFGLLVCVVMSARMMMICVFALICIDERRFFAEVWGWVRQRAIRGVGLMLLAIPAAWFVANKILLINNPWRGLNSNLSGRLPLWSQSLDTWRAHFWFGAGLRTTGDGPDNSYLYIAREMGLFGLAGWLAFLALILWQTTRDQDRDRRLNMWTLTLVYMTVGMTDNRGLNGGNAFSILMISLFFGYLAHRSQKR